MIPTTRHHPTNGGIVNRYAQCEEHRFFQRVHLLVNGIIEHIQYVIHKVGTPPYMVPI